MPLIYITGNSGAGKSSIRKELQRRGYEAHDTDNDGITAWINKVTNELVERPESESARTKEWYDQHEWKMSRQKVEEFAANAKDKLIFLCGSPSNADDMLDLYDKVVCLVVDKDTLKNRIASRTDHDFGKAPDELESILGWHDAFEGRYRDMGAVMIDATKPVEAVVDEILSKVVNFSQIGQESLQAYIHTMKNLLVNEPFDAIVAAGDSGQLAARIAGEVYRILGKTVPSVLVAPIYRHTDEAETILFDNTILSSQFTSWEDKPPTNVLFVDDEIGSGNALRGMIDLLLELSPKVQQLTIIAEDGGFDCPTEIRGVKITFVPTRKRTPHVFNAISYNVPWEFQEPLQKALADEPDLNNKQIMCTLLNLPTKEFHEGYPEFNERLVERAEARLPEFKDMQSRYQEHFQAQIREYL